jgi:hypothetical protein
MRISEYLVILNEHCEQCGKYIDDIIDSNKELFVQPSKLCFGCEVKECLKAITSAWENT